MNYKIKKLKKMVDNRGYLVEFLKNSELKNKNFGQNYFVTFNKKNKIRGNHYHEKKSEWFTIALGATEVKLQDIKTGEKKKIILSDNKKFLIRLFIGPNIAHSFKSLTNKAVLLNYTDKEFHKKNPDTYYFNLEK